MCERNLFSIHPNVCENDCHSHLTIWVFVWDQHHHHHCLVISYTCVTASDAQTSAIAEKGDEATIALLAAPKDCAGTSAIAEEGDEATIALLAAAHLMDRTGRRQENVARRHCSRYCSGRRRVDHCSAKRKNCELCL